MPKRRLKTPAYEDLYEGEPIEEWRRIQEAGGVYDPATVIMSYSDVREFQDNPRSFYLQDGAPHTTEDLITAALEGIKAKDADEIRQLQRKYDPYSLLHIVRRLRHYRERVWWLERRLEETRKEGVS